MEEARLKVSLKIFLTFAFFVCLSLIRSPDAIITPILYAEDGVWLTEGINKGWIWIAFNARPDYPTLFHAFTLWLASFASELFSGNPIWLAAIFVSIFGYCIWGGLASYIYFSFRRITAIFPSLLIAIGFIFIPLGSTSNETVGRVLQLGFLMPVLLALTLMNVRQESLIKQILRALLILCMALTSPVVIPIWFGWYTLDIYRTLRRQNKFNYVFGLLTLGLVVISVNIWFREKVPTAIPGGIKSSSLIETIFARAFLYPEIAPFYRLFTDASSTIAAALIAICIFLLVSSTNLGGPYKNLIYLFSYVWSAYLIATLATRPGLTQFLDDYSGTYPDRYFLGLNAIAWLLLGTIAISVMQLKIRRPDGVTREIVIYGVMTVLVIANVVFSTEIFGTRLNISHSTNWQSQLCNSEYTTSVEGLQSVAIEPAPEWKVHVASELIRKLPCQ